VSFITLQKGHAVNNTYFGLLAEFGEANIPLAKIAPKYFGLSFEEARRRAPTQLLPCRVFRLGGQKSPWLVSATDLAELLTAEEIRLRSRQRRVGAVPGSPIRWRHAVTAHVSAQVG
jgi:hypothetical protein